MRMKKIFSLFAACALVMSAAAVVPFAQRVPGAEKAVVRFDAETARQSRKSADDVAVKFDRSAKTQVAAAPVRLEISDEAKLSARRQLFGVAKAQDEASLDSVAYAYAIYYSGWQLVLFNADSAQIGVVAYASDDATHLVASDLVINDSTNAVILYAGKDTIPAVSGSFSIAFDHVDQSVPYYHLTSSELNTADDALELDVTFPVVQAMDYLAYMYCSYMGYYCDEVEIDLEDAPFVPSGDTVRITLTDLKFIDKVAAEGWWQLAGYNADSTAYVTFSNLETLDIAQAAGTYDFATEMDKTYTTVYLINGEDAEQIKFREGSIILDVDTAGIAHLAADLLAKNGDVYIFDLTSKAPVVSNNVITLAYANGILNVTTTNNDPYFLFIETKAYYDYDNDDFLQPTLNTEAEYWLSQLYQNGILSLASLSGNQTIDVEDFYGQFFKSDMEDGEYVALACAHDGADRAGDAVYTLFNYAAAPVVPTGDTIRIAGSGLEFEDQVASQGWWQLMGYSNDQQYYATFSNSTEVSQIAGTYDYVNDMDKDYTALYLITDPTSEDGYEKIALKQGSIVVTVENGIVKLHAELLGKNGTVYVLDLSSEGTAVDNVTVRPAAVKRIVNGQLIIEKDGQVYNAQGIRQ